MAPKHTTSPPTREQKGRHASAKANADQCHGDEPDAKTTPLSSSQDATQGIGTHLSDAPLCFGTVPNAPTNPGRNWDQDGPFQHAACFRRGRKRVGSGDSKNPLRDETISDITDALCQRKRALLHGIDASEEEIQEALLGLESFAAMIAPFSGVSWDHINEVHGKLIVKVNTVIEGCIKPFTWDSLTPEERAKLESWTPKAREYLGNREARLYLLHAWVWHILDDNIFSADPSKKWQTENAQAHWRQFGELMKSLQGIDLYEREQWFNKFQVWKGLSADLLGVLSGRQRSVTKEHVREVIIKEIGHLIDFGSGRRAAIVDSVLGSLCQFVARFDFELLISRGEASVVWHDTAMPEPKRLFGFPFKFRREEEAGVRMEGVEAVERGCWEAPVDYEGRPVDLVVSPGVLARGTDPYGYQMHEWLVPLWKASMVVVVDVPFGERRLSPQPKDEMEEQGEDVSSR